MYGLRSQFTRRPELFDQPTRFSAIWNYDCCLCLPMARRPEALERVVSHWAHRAWSNTPMTKGDDEHLQCMQLLLDMGARWNPAPEQIRYVRRNLKEREARYVVQVLRLLLYTPEAADLEMVLQLCDTTAFHVKIAEADPPLLQEIKTLRKQHKKLTA
jgi:hypothetical protein